MRIRFPWADRSPEPLTTSIGVWNALVASGVQETRPKSRLDGYDQELVRELNDRLFPGSPDKFSANLRRRPPTVEAFFDAFFPALKPFSMMMREMLRMFEQAGARRSDNNIQIVFNFDAALSPEVMELRHFREQVEVLRRISRRILSRYWTVQTLFQLAEDISRLIPQVGRLALTTASVRAWVEANGHPQWLEFPGFPRVGDARIDDWLQQAEGLIAAALAVIRSAGPTYDDLGRALESRARLSRDSLAVDTEDEVLRAREEVAEDAFLQSARDYWPNHFARQVCHVVEKIVGAAPGVREGLITGAAQAFEQGFGRPPRDERTSDDLERDLLDLLNLPAWKRRHELYAVWVGSRIASVLRKGQWVWHLDGDMLSFPFSGAQLANITLGGRYVEFWTEKRTPLPSGGVFGRRHIQPDYRLDEMPVHRMDATRFVVECKQYRKWSIKNFGAALADYAAGCPRAVIVLVNYGPVGSNVLTRVPDANRSRTHAIGDFRPDNPASLARFKSLVRASFPTEPELHIELTWQAAYPDLDLHVVVRPDGIGRPAYHVGFEGLGRDDSAEPWLVWPEDARRNPGRETITAKRIISAVYEIHVHLYGNARVLFPGPDIKLTVTLDGRATELPPPASQAGTTWWHAGTLHGRERRLEPVGRLSTSRPTFT